MISEIPTATERIAHRLFQEFDSPPEAITALLDALEEGWAIPYLARYRRQGLHGMSERRMYEIRQRLRELTLLEERKTVLLQRAHAKGLLDEGLMERILGFTDIELLDEIFLPALGERPDAAGEARAKGLGDLAARLRARQVPAGADPLEVAAAYVAPERGVPDAQTALAGARAILVEEIAQDPQILEAILAQCEVVARAAPGGKTPPKELRRYQDFRRPMGQVHWRDFLNLQKAARKGYIDLHFGMPEERAHVVLTERICPDLEDPAAPLRAFFDSLLREAWHERIKGPIERAVHRFVKDRADRGAIRVFARHYRDFLLALPVGRRRVCGILPAIRKPTRAVVVDEGGAILGACNLSPLKPEQREESVRRIRALLEEHKAEVVALGGGPGCREVEGFLMEAFAGSPLRPQLFTVEEAGAAQIAHRQHDRFDLRTRKAAILARRLQDPLAEWCCLEPDLVPLGPGQEEVRPSLLRLLLEDVRESVLHEVGVDLRTVRPEALALIAGLDREKAQAIVKLRNKADGIACLASLVEKGILTEQDLEQAAPFLRYTQSTNPLDATRIPPSRYGAVERIAASLGLSTGQLLAAPEHLERFDPRSFPRDGLGDRELREILDEIRHPFRDPRPRFEPIAFPPERKELSDLSMGQELVGRVTRITEFGAFVDVGIPPGGLLHVTEMSDEGPRDPRRYVKIGQVVRVRVLEVDPKERRLSLTMRSGEIRRIPRTLGEVAEGRRRPAAEVVRPGSASQVERGLTRAAQAPARPDRGARPGRGSRRGTGRDAGRRPARSGRRPAGAGAPRGPYTVESKDLEEAVREDRGFKGELKSLSALKNLLSGAQSPADKAAESESEGAAENARAAPEPAVPPGAGEAASAGNPPEGQASEAAAEAPPSPPDTGGTAAAEDEAKKAAPAPGTAAEPGREEREDEAGLGEGFV